MSFEDGFQKFIEAAGLNKQASATLWELLGNYSPDMFAADFDGWMDKQAFEGTDYEAKSGTFTQWTHGGISTPTIKDTKELKPIFDKFHAEFIKDNPKAKLMGHSYQLSGDDEKDHWRPYAASMAGKNPDLIGIRSQYKLPKGTKLAGMDKKAATSEWLRKNDPDWPKPGYGFIGPIKNGDQKLLAEKPEHYIELMERADNGETGHVKLKDLKGPANFPKPKSMAKSAGMPPSPSLNGMPQPPTASPIGAPPVKVGPVGGTPLPNASQPAPIKTQNGMMTPQLPRPNMSLPK